MPVGRKLRVWGRAQSLCEQRGIPSVKGIGEPQDKALAKARKIGRVF